MREAEIYKMKTLMKGEQTKKDCQKSAWTALESSRWSIERYVGTQCGFRGRVLGMGTLDQRVRGSNPDTRLISKGCVEPLK